MKPEIRNPALQIICAVHDDDWGFGFRVSSKTETNCNEHKPNNLTKTNDQQPFPNDRNLKLKTLKPKPSTP